MPSRSGRLLELPFGTQARLRILRCKLEQNHTRRLRLWIAQPMSKSANRYHVHITDIHPLAATFPCSSNWLFLTQTSAPELRKSWDCMQIVCRCSGLKLEYHQKLSVGLNWVCPVISILFTVQFFAIWSTTIHPLIGGAQVANYVFASITLTFRVKPQRSSLRAFLSNP